VDGVSIVDLNEGNMLNYGICGYKDIRREGYTEKIAWMKQRFAEGMKIKMLVSERDGAQGMIEYIPGAQAWRPVAADGHLFIHCIFVGFRKAYKGKGYGSRLLDECLKDAREAGFSGVSVVTRKGSFMAGRELFIQNGFETADTAAPDFELLVCRLTNSAPAPRFRGDWDERRKAFGRGLTIIRSDQCPYTVKNVKEICETAEKEFGLRPRVVSLKSAEEAQNSPCAFGTFCILYDGRPIAEHPISGTRFRNILHSIRSA